MCYSCDDRETNNKAFQFERYLIKPEYWFNTPNECQRIAKEYSKNCSIGISHHPDYGWAVIGTQGQGPFIIWEEKGIR